MALNEKQIAEMARHELGYPDAKKNLSLIALIPRAIERLATLSVQDESKKPLFLTPLATTVALDVNGRADLSTLMTSNKILVEHIDRGYVWHSSATKPLEFIQNPEMADLGFCEPETLFYWLRGRVLYTRNTTALVGTPLSGNLNLELPYIPTLANFPDEMQLDLIAKVVELKLGVRTDAAEDGKG